MIGRLRGTLVERSGDRVVIDCAGVGYEVAVSGFTAATLPAVGELLILRIYTHTNSQDFRITLFGFGSAEERELFDMLITVKKVGPTAALGILSSGMSPAEIGRLIVDEAVTSLMKIKGVGKKTAEMIVVELKDKCEMMLARWGASGIVLPPGAARVANAGQTAHHNPVLAQVATALVQMGWRPLEADKAVASLEPGPEASIENLLRQALQAMPR